MTFSLMDLFLFVIAGGFIVTGLYQGFVKTAGSLAGLVVGFFVATRIIDRLNAATALEEYPFWSIILFIVILIISAQIIAWVFSLVDQLVKILSIIPFLGSINRLLGGILGALEAFIALSAIFYFANVYLPEGAIRSALDASQVQGWVTQVTTIVLSFLP